MGNSNPAYKFQSIQASEKTASIAKKKKKKKYSWLYNICFQPGFSDALEKKVKSERDRYGTAGTTQ